MSKKIYKEINYFNKTFKIVTVSSREQQLKQENAAKDAKMAEMQALAERQAKQLETMMEALKNSNAVGSQFQQHSSTDDQMGAKSKQE